MPLCVISGFLGSGKTTLLNKLLTENKGVRYAVMVNDFGDLAIDEALIEKHDGETISFANGCVCCSMGDNLISAIDRLLDSEANPQQIVVEASGVANPKAIADVATLHPLLSRDLIVTLCDASTVSDRYDDTRLRDTLERQLQHADLIALNKCDIALHSEKQGSQQLIKRMSQAPIICTTQADIPTEILSGAALQDSALNRSGSIVRSAQINQDKKNQHKQNQGKQPESANVDSNAPAHNPEHTFYRRTFTVSQQLSLDRIKHILRDNLHRIIRAKGILQDNTQSITTLHNVQLSGKRVDSEILANTPKVQMVQKLVVISLQPLDWLSPLLEE